MGVQLSEGFVRGLSNGNGSAAGLDAHRGAGAG